MIPTLVDPPPAAIALEPRRLSRLGRALDAKCRPVPNVSPLALDAPVEASATHGSLSAVRPPAPVSANQPTPPIPFEPPLGGSERRLSHRYRVDGDVLVHRSSTGPGGRPRRVLIATPPDAFGRMIDISTGGVAFESDDDFQIGEALLLTLRANPRQPVGSVDLRRLAGAAVLRTLPLPQGGSTIVCRFERALSFEEVHRIGGHLFEATIV